MGDTRLSWPSPFHVAPPSYTVGSTHADASQRPGVMTELERLLAACSLGGAGHLQPLLPFLAAAERRGGQVLVVPTNTASYSTSQVPTQEIATARLQAIQEGRDLIQASPTGFTAIVDHRGHVVSRTTLGNQQVLYGTPALRTGLTPYARAGDVPVLAASGLAVLAAWGLELRSRRRASSIPS